MINPTRKIPARVKLSENKTAGLVNIVLHKRKVNHTIQNIMKKTAHLFRGAVR